MKSLLSHIANNVRPRFWKAGGEGDPYRGALNYRRIWVVSIILLAMISLIPLTILAAVTFNMAHRTIKNENDLRVARVASNTRRTVSYFLKERIDALKFIVAEKNFSDLNDPVALDEILANLKMGFGGFVDIGLIDGEGAQIRYSGPFELLGKNYEGQKWLEKTREQEVYVSDVFPGFRQKPHMVIAVRQAFGDRCDCVVRASLDIEQLIDTIKSLDLSPGSDAFLINREGVLQTPSNYFGGILDKIRLPVPEYDTHTRTFDTKDTNGKPLLIGYAYIEGSPFILVVVKQTREIMKSWYLWRDGMILAYVGGVLFIAVVILCVPAYMVNRIWDADQTRVSAMQKIENESRLASVGRLAAGVAHEINNPLAIINENAGFIKDLLVFEKAYNADERLFGLIDQVLESVERCGNITKQLLGFARHFEPKTQPMKVAKVINEVLSFLKKEAAYRNIEISLDLPEDMPTIQSDHGKLQQIFLNLINNAFQAMNDGGKLSVRETMPDEDHVAVTIEDNGCGMTDDDVKRIFEPFFSTKTKSGGTGLGLSITYGLIKKLEGDISVKTRPGEGTAFTVTLPLKYEGGPSNECVIGG